MVEMQKHGHSQGKSFRQLYRLTPINRLDPNWQTSVYRGEAVIRADSEDLARSLASKAFGTTLAPSSPGKTIATQLWQRTDAVQAELVQDQRYRSDGAAGILEPWGYS
jgi:hypothetical protein